MLETKKNKGMHEGLPPRGRRAAFTSSTSSAPAEAHRRGSDKRYSVNQHHRMPRSGGRGPAVMLRRQAVSPGSPQRLVPGAQGVPNARVAVMVGRRCVEFVLLLQSFDLVHRRASGGGVALADGVFRSEEVAVQHDLRRQLGGRGDHSQEERYRERSGALYACLPLTVGAVWGTSVRAVQRVHVRHASGPQAPTSRSLRSKLLLRIGVRGARSIWCTALSSVCYHRLQGRAPRCPASGGDGASARAPRSRPGVVTALPDTRIFLFVIPLDVPRSIYPGRDKPGGLVHRLQHHAEVLLTRRRTGGRRQKPRRTPTTDERV